MAEIAVGMAGSAAGGLLGNALSKDGPTLDEQMNQILNQYLKKGMGYNEKYTGKAIDTQQDYLSKALASLQTGNQQAQKLASNTMNNALSQSAAIRSPYIQQGNTAMDQYMRTLGLPVTKGGSSALTSAAQQAQQLAPLLKSLGGQYSTGAIGAAPTLDSFAKQVSQQQMQDYINQNLQASQRLSQHKQAFDYSTYTGVGADPGMTALTGSQSGHGKAGAIGTQGLVNQVLSNPNTAAAIRNQLAQSQFQAAQNQYNTKMGTFNQLGSLLGGMSADQQKLLATQLKGLL